MELKHSENASTTNIQRHAVLYKCKARSASLPGWYESSKACRPSTLPRRMKVNVIPWLTYFSTRPKSWRHSSAALKLAIRLASAFSLMSLDALATRKQPPEKNCMGGWVGSIAGPNAVEKRTTFFPSENWTRDSRSSSPKPVSYTDWVMDATFPLTTTI